MKFYTTIHIHQLKHLYQIKNMTTNQLKQIQEELIKLKSQDVVSVKDKLKIQKLQQSFDSIINREE